MLYLSYWLNSFCVIMKLLGDKVRFMGSGSLYSTTPSLRYYFAMFSILASVFPFPFSFPPWKSENIFFTFFILCMRKNRHLTRNFRMIQITVCHLSLLMRMDTFRDAGWLREINKDKTLGIPVPKDHP